MGARHNPELRKDHKAVAIKTLALAAKAGLSDADFATMVDVKNPGEIRKWANPKLTNYPTGKRWVNLLELNKLLREAIRTGKAITITPTKANGNTVIDTDSQVLPVVLSLVRGLSTAGMAEAIAGIATMLNTRLRHSA